MGVAFIYDTRQHITRFWELAGYSNAAAAYGEAFGRLPTMLSELERFYNNHKERRVELPSPSAYIRPIYRPVSSPSKERYLVFIEPKRQDLLVQYDRMLIYTRGDGTDPEIEWAKSWDLDELIAEDDKRRASRGAVPLSKPAD